LRYFAYAAQHQHVVGIQCRTRREAVEAVVLDLAARHAHERFLRDALDRLHVGDGTGASHPEVVQEDRVRPGAVDLVGDLVEHLEPHVLEHRQARRESHRGAEAEDPQAQRMCVAFHGPVEAHRERPRRIEGVDERQVAHRRARRYRVPVGDGKGVGVRAQRRGGALLAQRFHDGVLEVVLPPAHRLGDLGFDGMHVVRGHLARGASHQHVDAREHRFRQVDREFRARSVEVALEDLLDLHAHVGGVVLARDEDEARIEAPVHVAADEGPGLAPVSQA
jgi:hypothetical protein